VPTRLLLFGAPRLVRGQDGSEILPLQPKRAAVLAYLAVARPGPLHRRDSLLAMFWPELAADRGRAALSKVIHHLRQALPRGAILTQDDQVGIAGDRLGCDVLEFERALEGGRPEDALALYGGDLLKGFHLPGSPDFDFWADLERGRLRRMAVASAWEIASDAERAGDGARATRFARQAVRWAPRDEAAFRRFLTLLHSRGNRAEALEAFDGFARELRRDYGVDPSRPTLDLVEAIRDGSLPYALAPPLPVGSEPAAHAYEIESPGPAAAGHVVEAGPPLEPSVEAAGPPHAAPRPRRRLRAAAIGLGFVGLISMSRYAGGLLSLGGEERVGSVLVTEFDDGTGEGLGAVVSEALRVDLAQSRALALVDRVDIAGTLELMGLESGVPISAEVGRDVATRDGLEAVVEGAIVSAGSGYILTAAVREGGAGRALASFRESVTDPDGLIAVIDGLSREVREALGEEIGTIEASAPLARVTTSSLEALRLYTTATRRFDQLDDRSEAAELLQRAVALDPSFAMAWRMLGVALQNAPDQSLRTEAVRQAYRLRDRLSEPERYAVEASYYSTVEYDDGRGFEALQRILELDPTSYIALNNLGLKYLYRSDLTRAEEMFRRAVETAGVSSTAYTHLVNTRLYQGRIGEAAQALGEFEQAYPKHRVLPLLRARIQFLSGASDEARAGLRRIVDDPLRPVAERADAWAFLGLMAYWAGGYEEGRRGLLEAERVVGQADEAAAWVRAVETAHTAALAGDADWARAHMKTMLETGLPEGVVLRRPVTVRLIQLLALTSPTRSLEGMKRELESAPRVAGAYARIQAGDTVGLRRVIDAPPLHLFQRALLSDRLGDVNRTIELFEEVLRPGYTLWGSDPHRLRAMMRLGPLYEQAGDTLRAIEAYDAFARRWALGDEHGRAVAMRFADRARMLGTAMTSGAR